MKYAAYENYKSTASDWLGNVPSHWQVDRLKWSTTGSYNGVWGDEPNEIDDLICVRVADFDRERFVVVDNPPTMRAIEPSQRRNRLLQKNDLLIEKSGGGEKQLVGCVVQFTADVPAVSSNFVARLPVASGCDSRFLTYAHAAIYAGKLNYPSIKQTTGIQNLDSGEYLNILAPYPPFEEQQTIARFLDAKTAQIDDLIAKKRQLIDKLKEKRSALIARTVTRGLPPEAAKAVGLEPHPEMKDSGVEWMGKVPEQWDVVRVKFVAQVESGHTPSRSEPLYWIEEECVIPWVSLNDSKFLKENDFIGDTAVKISAEGMKNSSAHLLPAGAVVFTRDASIGLTAITTVPAAVSQHVIAWIPGKRVFQKYLLFVFKVMQKYLDSLTFGSTLKTIGMTDIRRITMPVPTIFEQQKISEFLDCETAQIGELMANIESAITRLTEYRQALISSAVTGKIDVRETPTLPEAA